MYDYFYKSKYYKKLKFDRSKQSKIKNSKFIDISVIFKKKTTKRNSKLKNKLRSFKVKYKKEATVFKLGSINLDREKKS